VGVSQEASCLFFAISDLGFIDPMYQYSLTYFLDLFIFSIESSEKSEDLQVRLENINAHFLFSLYRNISRSLFVKDKLLFSFLLSVRLKQFKNEIEQEQYDFLLTGAVGAVSDQIAQPVDFPWLKESQWSDICRLNEFGGSFENIHRNFANYKEDWERIYKSPEPYNEPFPEIYEDSLTLFEKIMLMRCLRLEKLKPMIQNFVIENLGKKFVEPPAFALDEIHKDSNNVTPLIFVLTPGVDPFNTLLQFAEQRSIMLQPISLGQG
jgi:dynein heavy chain